MAREMVQIGANSEEIEFFDPQALARAATRHETRNMWRGDHSKCTHADGTCLAKRCWIFDGETLELKPHVVPVSIERRMMGTVQGSGKGDYPQPTQEAKGMLNWNPAFEKVRPVPKLFQFHLDRILGAAKATLKKAGAKFPEIKAELAALETKAREVNGFGKAKEKKA